LRGPTRKFPFRYGEGEFAATAQVRGVTLDYFPGLAPLTDGAGTVHFVNSGLEGELRSGKMADLAIGHANFAIADLKDVVVDVAADAHGDVASALGYLQRGPLAANLGTLFNQVSGSGPADYTVNLSVPLADPAARDYRVRTQFHSATLSLPSVRAPVVDLTGMLEVHNLTARATDLRGSFLDGPFEATVAPDNEAAIDDHDLSVAGAAVNLHATGRASGPRLPAFIGLPEGIGMRGMAPWDVTLRSERIARGEPWNTRIDIASNLVGLTIDAPKPFAKGATEARDTHVRLAFNAGERNDVQIQTGRARAQLAFLARDGHWQLERGLARFDGGPMPRTSRSGLQVVGRLAGIRSRRMACARLGVAGPWHARGLARPCRCPSRERDSVRL
jgi:uncharacterized protein YhdP